MSTKRLLILLVAVISLYTLTILTKNTIQTAYYDTQTEAGDKFSECMQAVKDRKLALGFEIDAELDPQATGMIGLPWPGLWDQSISTTRGSLPAKQLSTNPNFAALIVRYFQDLRITAGDYVAVNFSGSFPALNLAVMAAIEVMELQPIIASSIGASTYGANDPEFTYIDMERHLYDEGILSNQSLFVSLGGANDQLLEVDDTAFKQDFLDKYENLGYTVINEDDIFKNIADRYAAYHALGIAIKAFVNVGGNQVSFGQNSQYYQNGLIKRLSVSVAPGSGLIDRFLRDDIPVIHLLNVEDLALKNGMSVDLEEPFAIGIGTMYGITSYHNFLIYLNLLIFALFLGYNCYIERRKTKRRCVAS